MSEMEFTPTPLVIAPKHGLLTRVFMSLANFMLPQWTTKSVAMMPAAPTIFPDVASAAFHYTFRGQQIKSGRAQCITSPDRTVESRLRESGAAIATQSSNTFALHARVIERGERKVIDRIRHGLRFLFFSQ